MRFSSQRMFVALLPASFSTARRSHFMTDPLPSITRILEPFFMVNGPVPSGVAPWRRP